MMLILIAVAVMIGSSSIGCNAFVVAPRTAALAWPSASKKLVLLRMVDPVSTVSETLAVSNSLLLAETEAWVQPAAFVLDPFLNVMSFAMLARVVLSWYPEQKATSFPWILVVFPTEPLLRVVKGVVPPAFGVDITPVFWLAIFTFVHEILLGQQGLLTMKIKYGI
jgi:YggT family protein